MKIPFFQILGFIFILALSIRFLYFPDNTYFGYDQARDAFTVKEILNGNLTTVGPTTSFPPFRHGVLYYYLYAPFYHISNGNPEIVSLFIRITNSLGVFLIFAITTLLFGAGPGVIASLLYAFSFEQTQFSLFLNHPAFVVVSLQLFYLGLALWLFKREKRGLYLALFGLGSSIQFEFVEIQLIPILLLYLLFFRNKIPKFNVKNLILAFLVLSVPLATFYFNEVRYHFPSITGLSLLLQNTSQGGYAGSHPADLLILIHRFFLHNFLYLPPVDVVIPFIFFASYAYLLYRRLYTTQLIFLSIWFFGGFLIYFFIRNDAYFYNTGTSISLLVFASLLIFLLSKKNMILAVLCIGVVLVSNISQVMTQNPNGPNQQINLQKGMLLSSEKQVIDYIYTKAERQPFSVNAISMPFFVNTTWSYLFEWYGQQKYGYLPVWGGQSADGFMGNLLKIKNPGDLPELRFLIIEPEDGIPSYMTESFLSDSLYQTGLVGKKQFGTIEVMVFKLK